MFGVYPLWVEILHLTLVIGSMRVNEKELKLMHRRTASLHYKMLLMWNNCTEHAQKLLMVSEDSSAARYQDASSSYNIMEALLNFDRAIHNI